MNIITCLLYKVISFFDKYHQKNHIDDMICEQYELSDHIEIQTDTGFKPISYIYLTRPFANYILELDNGYWIECADNHIVFDCQYNEIFVKDLNVGNFILTDEGPAKVMSITNTCIPLCMGDLTVDDDNHRFYSNGILSHNSVVTGIYGLWKVLFNNDINGLVLSKSGPAGKDLIKKIKDMYMYLPYHLKAGTMKWNQSELTFDNNSSLTTEAFSDTAGLGKTINVLILDEFAWCPPNDVDLFYENIIPTVTTMTDSNVAIMSTQNGFNKFYQIWNGAITKKNVYAPFKTDWYEVPQWNPATKQWDKRTEEWKQTMIGVLGSEEAFYYQYGTQFSASDKCLVSRECLSVIRDRVELFVDRDQDMDSLVMLHPHELFIDPRWDVSEFKKGFFMVFVDLAEGGGGDYTVFQIVQIIDKDKFIQRAMYRANKISLEDAALDFWLMCPQLFAQDHYIVSIEWNTYGALFYNYLMQLNEDTYRPEYLVRFNYSEEFDINSIVHYKKGSQEEEVANIGPKINKAMIPGIRFSSGNKKTACALLRILIEKDQLQIMDLVTSSELENFEDKIGNGSYKASFGHDDTIMPLAQLPMVQNTPKYKDFIEDVIASNMPGATDSPNFYEDYGAPFADGPLPRISINNSSPLPIR